MGNEQYFEIPLNKDIERRFQVNGLDYLVKYTCSRSLRYGYEGRRGILTVESKSDLSVFVLIKLYRISNQDCVLTRSSVLETKQAKFQVNLDGNNYGSGLLICSVKVSRYEKWRNVLDTAQQKNPTKIVTSSKGPTTESASNDLASDMKRLLEQCEFPDVILSDGSKEFRAHKLILSARSKVFSKMFQHPMKEMRENRVIITDVSSDVLKELLAFIYTDVVTIKDMKMARDLYMAADKYDVKELRVVCLKNLKNVDLDSVLDTLTLADLYGDKTLKQSALNFISENYSRVKVHTKWGSFMKENQALALEVLSFVLDERA